MNVYAVDTIPEHLEIVAGKMRADDVREIWAAGKRTPLSSLKMSFYLSKYRKTIMLDGEPVGLFGVVPQSALGGTGVPWMLGTDAITKISRKFLRGCKVYVPEMISQFERLENYVDARNTVSIQWLKWLGFVIMEPEPYGHLNLPFHRFYMENHNVCAN